MTKQVCVWGIRQDSAEKCWLPNWCGVYISDISAMYRENIAQCFTVVNGELGYRFIEQNKNSFLDPEAAQNMLLNSTAFELIGVLDVCYAEASSVYTKSMTITADEAYAKFQLV